MKNYSIFIDGKWINSITGKTFHSLNPSNEKTLGYFQSCNSQDVEKAINAAEKAYPSWNEMPAPKRGELLFKVAKLLKQDKERLTKLIVDEMGKVYKEAAGDVQEAIDIFEYMGGEGRRLFGITTPSELKNKLCMTLRSPIGVVACITPWNFPIAIPAWKLSAALICGNTIVFKPSSDTPLCAIELIKILDKAGIPNGVVNLVTGSGEEVGNYLIRNKKIKAVSFTGSKSTGEFILKNSGIKKVGLELGGKNPIVIMEDADLSLALEGVLWGAFGTSGQRCTAASRVIIHKDVKDKFEKMLLSRVKKLKLGYGGDKNVDIGPLINKKALEKVHNYTQIGLREGAKLICGGKLLNKKGFFYSPTIFTNVTKNMRIAQEEIFGPSLSIIKINNLDEAIDVCNSVDYGLSASIYTKNMEYAFKAIQKIESGLVYVNSSTIGSEVHLPFGGVKQTGNGTREGGVTGIEEFSELKTVYVDYSGELQKTQGIS